MGAARSAIRQSGARPIYPADDGQAVSQVLTRLSQHPPTSSEGSTGVNGVPFEGGTLHFLILTAGSRQRMTRVSGSCHPVRCSARYRVEELSVPLELIVSGWPREVVQRKHCP